MNTNETFNLEYAPAPESTKIVNIAKSYDLFIGGKFVKAKSGKTFSTINPATEEHLSTIAEASTDDVNKAVKAARKGYENYWRDMPGKQRARYLYRIARQIQERSREFSPRFEEKKVPG